MSVYLCVINSKINYTCLHLFERGVKEVRCRTKAPSTRSTVPDEKGVTETERTSFVLLVGVFSDGVTCSSCALRIGYMWGPRRARPTRLLVTTLVLHRELSGGTGSRKRSM